MEEDEVAVGMEDEHTEETEDQEEEQNQDVIMEYDAKQQEASTNRTESALAAGDFDTQFPKMNDKTSNNAPGQGVNRQ